MTPTQILLKVWDNRGHDGFPCAAVIPVDVFFQEKKDDEWMISQVEFDHSREKCVDAEHLSMLLKASEIASDVETSFGWSDCRFYRLKASPNDVFSVRPINADKYL